MSGLSVSVCAWSLLLRVQVVDMVPQAQDCMCSLTSTASVLYSNVTNDEIEAQYSTANENYTMEW